MIPQHEICLVVPTIRENSFREFIKRWKAIGLFDSVDLFVIEDNPNHTFKLEEPDINFQKFSWLEIDSEIAGLGKEGWIIPRRSDTVRSFGYWWAYHEGYKYILTLDDDCYPPTEKDGLVYKDGWAFVYEHVRQLEGRTRWHSTLNTARPRGLPYKNIGSWSRNLINHGIWTNVLDYDAANQLANPIQEDFSFDNKIVPYGIYFPMCGMNVMWKREATVLMYHLLMGHMFHDKEIVKLPFDRFGDIWCGILAKKICDSSGYTMSTGMPYIRHERASNPFTNLKKEVNGIEVNEKFWEYVDFANLGQGDLTTAYYKMGEHISLYDDFEEYKGYFSQLGNAMKIWSHLF